MTASRKGTPDVSPDAYDKTDFAQLDAHEITAEEYEELPELTDETVARAVRGDGTEPVRRARDRPKLEHPERQITPRLDADLVEAMRAGPAGRCGPTRLCERGSRRDSRKRPTVP